MKDVFVSHFARESVDATDTVDGNFCLHNRTEDVRDAFPVVDFYPYAFERFKVVLHETKFLRYAKKLIRTLLLVDPASVLVVDEQTGRISGVWPTSDELRYRIRIDELEIFGLENGNVVVR